MIIIPIFIPGRTYTTYTCEVEGNQFKFVRCEYCGFVYVYNMRRSAISTSTMEGHASRQARSSLQEKLDEDCDAVPCMECGKYQAHMVAALKRDFNPDARDFGRIALVVGGIFSLLAVISAFTCLPTVEVPIVLGCIAGGLVVAGGGSLYWRSKLLEKYEPNETDLGERMQIAARYGKSLDDFKAYLDQLGIQWEMPKA